MYSNIFLYLDWLNELLLLSPIRNSGEAGTGLMDGTVGMAVTEAGGSTDEVADLVEAVATPSGA